MIVIVGATGHTGRPAAEALLAKGEKIRAVGRDAKKLEPRSRLAPTRDHLRLLALELGPLLVEADELLADQSPALQSLAGKILPAELQRGAGVG